MVSAPSGIGHTDQVTLRVGVIGTGLIGQDHIRRLTHVLAGAEVVAVADADADLAAHVASGLKNATVHPTGLDLVADPEVDAVLVASWGPTHEEFVLACLAVGKPVFCEKPLATTERACREIMAAEVKGARRLVQVGFMRRYDESYLALKRAIDEGNIGAPLIYYSAHRNASTPTHYTSDMAIADTAVHDFDITRWLLGEEFTSIHVLPAKPNSYAPHLRDPLLMVLRTVSGVLVTVETSVNIGYGYDIRGEVVGERGTAALAERGAVQVRLNNAVGTPIAHDWRDRFAEAYDAELQDWIDALADGRGASGPSVWDGYVAQVVCDAGLESLASGVAVDVRLTDQPALYRR